MITNPRRERELSHPSRVFWLSLDCLIIVATLGGNILTLCAIRLSRKLSSMLSNKFIFSLAVSDLMVGLSLPFHMVFYLDDTFGHNKIMCLLRFCLILFSCASSICNLLCIATDRYVAIIYPLHYARRMTKTVSRGMTVVSRLLPLAIATVPLYWNRWEGSVACDIDDVLDADFLNYVITPFFGTIWLAMFFVYIRIWREAAGHARRLRSTANFQQASGLNDSKSVQVVLIILGCFSICWLPYFFTINWMSFRRRVPPCIYETAFTMAIANSCVNPIVYAWKNANFRQAFLCILRCRSPNAAATHKPSYITNHVPGGGSGGGSKKGSVDGVCNGLEADIVKNEIRIEMVDCRAENRIVEKEEGSIGTSMTNIST